MELCVYYIFICNILKIPGIFNQWRFVLRITLRFDQNGIDKRKVLRGCTSKSCLNSYYY